MKKILLIFILFCSYYGYSQKISALTKTATLHDSSLVEVAKYMGKKISNPAIDSFVTRAIYYKDLKAIIAPYDIPSPVGNGGKFLKVSIYDDTLYWDNPTDTSGNALYPIAAAYIADSTKLLHWSDTLSKVATAYDLATINIATKQNNSDTTTYDATKYFVRTDTSHIFSTGTDIKYGKLNCSDTLTSMNFKLKPISGTKDSTYIEMQNSTNKTRISAKSNYLYIKDADGYGKLYSQTITLASALASNDSVTSGNPYVKYSLVDDGSYTVKTAISGRGSLSAVDGSGNVVAYADFYFNTDGTVYNITSTSNVIYTDTDTYFCIFDNGSGIKIRNRLGATHTLKLQLWY